MQEHSGGKKRRLISEETKQEPQLPVPLPRSSFEDAFEPSVLSQDSAYFSFSRVPAPKPEGLAAVPSSPGPSSSVPPLAPRGKVNESVSGLQPVPRLYYTAAFDYVLTQVLKRYRDVLRPSDLELVALLQKQEPNALALFVRMYCRKPRWIRVSALRNSYCIDIDVDKAVSELHPYRLVVSSRLSVKDPEKELRAMLAKEVLPTCNAEELKSMCSSVCDGHKFRRLRKARLLSKLCEILSEGWNGPLHEKKRQTTLTGLSRAECLANAVLRTAGHCVSIPRHVLLSLQRIHFLFFLEDGHDSPNVMLAHTGKAKFPSYKCVPKRRIFPSSCAFLQYEAATKLERRLNFAMESKDFIKAADLGSIAELEVREYITSQDRLKFPGCNEAVVGRRVFQLSNTAGSRSASVITAHAKAAMLQEAAEQLQHPFLKRYTSQWVYARIAWYSVDALEKLHEYENAVHRLKLLLSTGLIPKRRGKCLNRLTINLYKNLGRFEEALNIIVDALGESSPSLHLGDRMLLANRGMSIHRKLVILKVDRASKGTRAKGTRRTIIAEEVISSIPSCISEVVSRVGTKVHVRRIYGKSVQVSTKELKRTATVDMSDPWQSFREEGSRDSMQSESTQDSSLMGKSVFLSMGSAHRHVSVEEYCLQWYLGKEGWTGVHDEGASVRFLYSLLFWECALFSSVDDVFQTPYQDRPLDLYTEAYYSSRKNAIACRIECIREMNAEQLRYTIRELYKKYDDTRAVGCVWQKFSADCLSDLGAGMGGWVLSRCCRLLSEDYAYWGGGLPDLTLWRKDGPPNEVVFSTKFVEVKSARDTLSERQRAWLIELQLAGADCEVCKVVEKVTAQNSVELRETTLDSVAISAIDEGIEGKLNN